MSKSTVEWYVTENDADWQALTTAHVPADPPPLSPPTHRSLEAQRYLEAIAAILLLLAITGALWWRTAQARVQHNATDINAIAQASFAAGSDATPFVTITGSQPRPDDWFQHAGEIGNIATAIQNAAPDDQTDEVVHSVAMEGDQLLARLVAPAKDGAPAYRQARFYQRTAAGWQPSAPDANEWGPAQRLETPSFIFQFRRNDAAAVITVASQLETFYSTLRHDYDLARTPSVEKLVIEVSLTHKPGDTSWFIAPQRLVVASPQRYHAPVDITDAELLAQSLALPLLDVVLAQAKEQHAANAHWEPLLDALQLWETWDMDLPLALWQEGLVRWIYDDIPSATPGKMLSLPASYQDLCAVHKLWMLYPAQIDIPLTCAGAAAEAAYQEIWRPLGPPTRLEQLILPVSVDPYVEAATKSHQPLYAGQTIALTTIVDYAVVTYGRKHLPSLMAALGQHDTWETLLPAIYGVSAAEFERDWQAYLTDRYGVSSVTPAAGPDPAYK